MEMEFLIYWIIGQIIGSALFIIGHNLYTDYQIRKFFK